jgi:hypothetical protein
MLCADQPPNTAIAAIFAVFKTEAAVVVASR